MTFDLHREIKTLGIGLKTVDTTHIKVMNLDYQTGIRIREDINGNATLFLLTHSEVSHFA